MDWLRGPCRKAARTASGCLVFEFEFEFEAALARTMRDRRVEQGVDAILERFVVGDCIQHDPNISENGRARHTSVAPARPHGCRC